MSFAFDGDHASLPELSVLQRWASCLCCRWSFLAVAMVLSIASAIPIVFVCRLPECARRGKSLPQSLSSM